MAIGFLISWSFSEGIFDFIRLPIVKHLPTSGLIFTAPMDKFLAHIKVSLFSGVVLASPFWIYQVWAFVSPGLHKTEKHFGIFFIFFGTTLFLTGISFVYYIVYPLAFDFLMNFGGGTDQPMISINEYLSFFITTTFVFGITFEMPLIFTILARLGIVSKDFLAKNRRYAIVLLAMMSAMFTPPDVISMLLMLIPMVLLYELSILLVSVFGTSQKV